MKRLMQIGIVLATSALVAVAVTSLNAPAVADEQEDPGKAVFVAQKCNMCHSVPGVGIEAKVKSEKMKGPDIVGIDRDAELLVKYLKKQAPIEDKEHSKEFKGTDEELKTVVEWVLSQK
jgi:mono/diheme cytochrome c family protein